jgi:2-phosphosulfolactate phosphatase
VTAATALLEWGPEGARRLGPVADVLVVVDVLSFTTAVDVAVGVGASVAPGHQPRPGDLVAVPRGDVDEEHPWSLSPTSLAGLPAGSRLLLPSPNGSAIAAEAGTAGVPTVLAGCLRNAGAVGRAAAARAGGGTVAVVPAGEREADGSLRPALEDLLGAGAVLAALGADRLSPDARAAVAAFAALRPELATALAECPSGRELVDAGWPQDVAVAAELDASPAVPLLVDGAFSAA